jgi:hypothetical protein
MALFEVLARSREDVIARWKGLVRGKFAPESMSTLELLDHVPRFLDEMLEALASGDTPASAARRDHSVTATDMAPSGSGSASASTRWFESTVRSATRS